MYERRKLKLKIIQNMQINLLKVQNDKLKETSYKQIN